MTEAEAIHVSAVFVYPLKGAGGVSLASAEVTRAGLRHDRRFVLVTSDGRFVSQRTHPRLATVAARLDGERLTLAAPGVGSAELPLAWRDGPRRAVRIWEDTCEGIVVGGDAAALLRSHLADDVELLALPEGGERTVDAPHWKESPLQRQRAIDGDRVGFADAYPILLASEASLAALNAHLAEPVPMNRFRPNLVIRGATAWAEDRWWSVRVGGGALGLRALKPCSRCAVITVDQATGEARHEPLRTLAALRTSHGKVLFGENLAVDPLRPGDRRVAVGDRVEPSAAP